MARFLRVSDQLVLDKFRILGVFAANSLWFRKPMIRVKYYNLYDYDRNSHAVRPMWYWLNVKYDSVADRDHMLQKLQVYVPKRVLDTTIIDDE